MTVQGSACCEYVRCLGSCTQCKRIWVLERGIYYCTQYHCVWGAGVALHIRILKLHNLASTLQAWLVTKIVQLAWAAVYSTQQLDCVEQDSGHMMQAPNQHIMYHQSISLQRCVF